MQATKPSEVVDRLIARTEAGEVRWKDGVRVNTFQASLPDYSVIIERWDDPRAVMKIPSYSMRILSQTGQVVASLADDGHAESGASHPRRPVIQGEKMARLFAAAERSVSVTEEKTFDDLLARLG